VSKPASADSDSHTKWIRRISNVNKHN